MPIREKTFWLDTAEMPVLPQHPLPDRVDVAVIGAGFTGLSAARTLAKRGAKVAVLESHTVGWGASSRNGGMVLTGLKLGATTLISRYGKEMARRMYDGSLKSIDCVEAIVREEKFDCDFSRCGHLGSSLQSRSTSIIFSGKRKSSHVSSATHYASYLGRNCKPRSARPSITAAWSTKPVRA